MRAASIAIVAAAVVACGGSSSGGDANGGDAGVDSSGSDAGSDGAIAASFCAQTFAAAVTTFEGCCTDADKATTTYATTSKTLESFRDACAAHLADSAASGRVAIDPAAASACASAIASGCASAPPRWMRSPCRGAVRGLQSKGAPCSYAYECADGLDCGPTLTCGDPPAAGEHCLDASSGIEPTVVWASLFGFHPPCAAGLVCSGTCNTASAACPQEDIYCPVGQWCAMDTCGTEGAVGSACTSSFDCAQDAYCNPTTGQCTSKKSASASCASVGECKGACDFTTSTCASYCGSG